MFEGVIILLLIILLPAAVFDFKCHRIPNIISLSGWIIGPVLYAVSDALPGVSSSLYGFLLIFALSLPLYVLRWMGAGDVKLMAGVGAIVGIEHAPIVFLGIVMTGAVMGVIMLLHSKLIKDSFQRYATMLGVGLTLKKPMYLAPNEQEQKVVLPYAIPIAVGTFLSIGLIYVKL
ncbi:MAG: prepilin peptidase [Gammaproteobacteria bacterium]|nr:prepilin peptidase [Gammaproteobacteria bacterium]